MIGDGYNVQQTHKLQWPACVHIFLLDRIKKLMLKYRNDSAIPSYGLEVFSKYFLWWQMRRYAEAARLSDQADMALSYSIPAKLNAWRDDCDSL